MREAAEREINTGEAGTREMEEKKKVPITMWTGQEPLVLDTVEREGIYLVKREFIEKKYGDTAWIFKLAYGFFAREMAKRVGKREGAESPIWLFSDPKWVFRSRDTQLLKLELPAQEVVLFDGDKWNRVLNLSYVGTKEEVADFEEECKRQGVRESSELFSKPFYPLLKKKVMDSWQRIFEWEEPPSVLQGAIWCLKREHIKGS